MLNLCRYSLGVGDRFGLQASYQLAACKHALDAGKEITPVWNKSHREHAIVGSSPEDVRAAADSAVKTSGWSGAYFVDADHIRAETVGAYLGSCDFFTIDVADYIGQSAPPDTAREFLRRHPELCEPVSIPGLQRPVELSHAAASELCQMYLAAAMEAGRIYRQIAAARFSFICEVSMDETSSPQSPAALLLILAALSDERIPLHTIAPKFSGRFNKGVDYEGNLQEFEKEFRAAMRVLEYAAKHYGLPPDLKLSVHSGSDKFSIYPAIHRTLRESGCGVHVKTAGTTWLEEVIGLAASDGDGLAMAKQIYVEALKKLEELCAPYSAVVRIDHRALPSAPEVLQWESKQFVSSLDHDGSNCHYNPNLRQLMHVGYKIAAGMGEQYRHAVKERASVIGPRVTANLYEKHIRPLFFGESA